MKSVLTIILILFLVASNIPLGFSDLQQTDAPIPQNFVDDSSALNETRIISISLHENIGIVSNQPSKKDSIDYSSISYTSESFKKLVSLSEKLDIKTSLSEQQIQFNTFLKQPQATLDRISQIDKVKDRKKNIKSEILYLDDTYKQDSSDDFNLIESPISQTTFFVDLPPIISNSVFDYNFENILQSIDGFVDPSLDTIFNSVVLNFYSSFDLDVNFVVIIFAPLVFFLFIFAEDVKFKIEKIRPILSLVFVLILLSTTVITPYSISSSYWPMAYVDTSVFDDNSTASADNTSSSSTPAEDTETAEATTSQTSVNDLVTNSTGTDIPVILPNATEYWQFDTQVNGSRFIGDVYIEETDSSLILDGDGYVSNDGNSTSDISNISVTVWVNPDYSGGSAEFTVVSKEKSFALTINNNITPQHIAKFAVFDGIKWHAVETVTQIGNDWSHIAATFNGATLSIYTNGTLSNINDSIETISINLDGQLEPKTVDNVSSPSDVVIGATLETQRTDDEVTKKFYGEIKEINIFDVYLTAAQVTEIYLQTLPIIESLYNNTTTQIIEEEIIIIDVLLPETITNSTNINGTNIDTTNSTDTIITFNDTQGYIPIVEESLNEELDKLTISTWINPDYTTGSAEFTVVSKENSFILGINNIYSPEKVPTFAIFDGITWTKIIGETQITDWSHLVAVINGTEISLYLNGNLEAQATLPETFVIIEGEMSPISAEIAESDSDLIIGAYLNTLRGTATLSNHFSGTVEDVLIYKDALSQAQINEIYLEMIDPSGLESSIPFESQLLSFTDHITITLNNSTISETILVASVNSTSNAPTVFQSLSFTDYVSYKLNGSTMNSSVDVMVLSDVVIVTVISTDMQNDIGNLSESLSINDSIYLKINGNVTNNQNDIGNLSESLSINDSIYLKINGNVTNNQNNTSLIETLYLEDDVIISLNGIFDITLSEILSLNTTITTSNYTTPTSNILSDIQLGHDTIEIGKSVIWTHNVTFANATGSVAIEIPADAEILSIKLINATTETVIFDSKDYESMDNSAEISDTSNGLYDDEDISEKYLKKYFRLIDSVDTIESQINETNSKIAYYANLDTAKAYKKLDKLDSKLDKLEEKLDIKLDKLSMIIPMASLQQVDEMLQEDMPLKVLLLNETAETLELTFMTPAPYTLETDNSTNGKYVKKVTVTHDSALHYTNVTAFSNLPENLVSKGVEFSLFWNINGSRVDVTNDERFAVEFVDTNGNEIADQMQWIVPQLSEQEFEIEAEINIINVQSYPTVGGT